MAILVTGGAGFIGSNFVLEWLAQSNETLIVLDKLTYAGNLANLPLSIIDQQFVEGSIGDYPLMLKLLTAHKVRAIVNFAAESHVDRSINSPEDFIQTNIADTFQLLKAACVYWNTLPKIQKERFRFLQVSTDEVYGTLSPSDPPFKESNCYQPNSPYSASKAAADHFVRACHQTYGLPTLTTHCSNNYGPYQFPEKLIPLCIHHALSGKPLPLYGDGQQVRDWLYVKDHCRALCSVLQSGKVGNTYNIGGWNEKNNLEVVNQLCTILDQERPLATDNSYKDQIVFIQDRPGHDRRYAIDTHTIEQELGWRPMETFHSGLRKTILWYLNNQTWLTEVIKKQENHAIKLTKPMD